MKYRFQIKYKYRRTFSSKKQKIENTGNLIQLSFDRRLVKILTIAFYRTIASVYRFPIEHYCKQNIWKKLSADCNDWRQIFAIFSFFYPYSNKTMSQRVNLREWFMRIFFIFFNSERLPNLSLKWFSFSWLNNFYDTIEVFLRW